MDDIKLKVTDEIKATDMDNIKITESDTKHSEAKDLLQQIQKTQADVEKTERKIEKQGDLLIFGFFVLLVMVATMVIMVLFQYINSNNSLKNQQHYLDH